MSISMLPEALPDGTVLTIGEELPEVEARELERKVQREKGYRHVKDLLKTEGDKKKAPACQSSSQFLLTILMLQGVCMCM